MEYRALPAAHRDAFREITAYAFAPEQGPDFEERDEDRPTLREDRALYDADPGTPTADLDPATIRAVCGYHEFTTRLRGDWHVVGGVSAVASPPEGRRQGNVARLLDGLLAEFREEGIAFSALWPFEYGFYRRFGWAVAHPWHRLTVAPGDLAGAVADPAGSFRRLDADDWEDVDRVHRAWATEAFAVRRTEGWWRHRVFDPPWRDVYAYGWESDDSELRAYLVYSAEEADDEKRLSVHELGAVDEAARRQIRRFLRDHDSQVGTIRRTDRDLSHLFETLSDPAAADVEVRPGPMVRIVDVAAAVGALSVPADVTGVVVVGVTDDRCTWNDGTFELRFDGGDATCEPTDAAPDVELDVGALSQLLTGCVPLARLHEHGDVAVHDDAAATTLAAAYPEEPVFLREGF